MAAPKEKLVQRKIVVWLNRQTRCRARTHTAAGPYNQSGEPDIDAVIDGLAVKLEVKRQLRKGAAPVNELTREAFVSRGATDLQAKTLSEYVEAGAVAGVVTCVEEVAELLAEAGIRTIE